MFSGSWDIGVSISIIREAYHSIVPRSKKKEAPVLQKRQELA
jgi:hypothetical protein